MIDEQLAALRRDPALTGVFLDFDGTLAPIVPDPASAEIALGATEVLESLARRYRLVALISGRGAQDLRSRVGATGVRYFGLYGAEEMTAHGLVQAPEAAQWHHSARILAREALEVIEQNSLIGCEIEFKDLAISIHYRQTGNTDPPAPLLEWARERGAAAGFRAGIGRMVIELRPGQVSKSAMFERLALEAHIQNAVVAGDDSADVEMMRRAVEILPGVVLRLGLRSTEEPEDIGEVADVQVGSPAELIAFLSRLL